MRHFKENWEIKLMAILLAVLLWLALRLSPPSMVPAPWPPEAADHG
ncbi:MAG TPA: hypothetical protein PKC50_10645 [Elusimicrobiota bacterium]|nr:hypothetical protein [Elusimicrobiota bacterium]